jgi:hypothetical protein
LPFSGGGKAQAAESSARVTCLNPGTGQPEAFTVMGGDNLNGPDTYEGGYPVLKCLGGQDLVIRPDAPDSTVHTITASCPTSNPVIEEKSHTLPESNLTFRYVVARCDPAGETLTLDLASPPGVQGSVEVGGEYAYANNPGEVCPPNCGIAPPPPEVGPAERAVAICRRRADPPGGDPNFNVDGCIAELGRDGESPLFIEAVEFTCTLQVEGMPTGSEEQRDARQEAFDTCRNEEYIAAGKEDLISDEAGKSGPSCESEGGAVAWILCPVVNGLLSALDSITKGPLQDLLRYDALTTDTADNPLYDVWRNFVRIANILFILAFMVIIFSQALSLNIDAYTVRKMLPRVVIGIILVQLSYYLMAFMVDIFNVLGSGVAALILSPIEGLPTFQALITPIIDDNAAGSGAVNVVGGALAIANLSALGGAAVGLLWGFLLLLPTILFIILAVVTTLILRKALIAGCIVFAPIALVAWILPNTDKIFKQWWELFVKGLLMYPLIMGMLAIGKFAGALIVANGRVDDGGGDIFNTFAALLVNVAIYGLALLAWRFADRLVGGIARGFLKARGFRGLGGAAAGGGGRGGGSGGGGGGPASGYRAWINNSRTRAAAGVGRLGQSAFGRFAAQKPKGWTLNPLRGFRPSQLRPRNLRADPRAAVRGAFGGVRTPAQHWQGQRQQSEGAAEAQFNALTAAAGKNLEAAGLSDDQDVLEALSLGPNGAALLRQRAQRQLAAGDAAGARDSTAQADQVELLQQRHAQFMKPEYQLAAAQLRTLRDPGSTDEVEDSDAMLAFQAVADMFRSDPAKAAKEVSKMAATARKNGRQLQSTFVYDPRDNEVHMAAGGPPSAPNVTTDRQIALNHHVVGTNAADLVGTHSSSVVGVVGALEHNLSTGVVPTSRIDTPTGRRAMTPDEVRTRSAKQLGELLASDRLEPTFRAELERIYTGLSTSNPALHLEAQNTARALGVTL